MKTHNLVLILSCCLVIGCHSFNRILIDENGEEVPISKIVREKKLKKVRTREPIEGEKTPSLCTIYLLPDLAPIPELPIRELKKIKPNNNKEIDRIQLEHIERLRLYIIDLKKTIKDSHDIYLSNCIDTEK